MPAQSCSTCYPVDGLIEAIDTDITKSHHKLSLMGLSHLIEYDCASQSGFSCEVLACRDVIVNELFADRPDDCANRLGNADVRATVQLGRMVVRIEIIAAELASGKRTRLSTAGRSGSDVHDRHPLSPKIPIRAGLHIRGKFFNEAVAVL